MFLQHQFNNISYTTFTGPDKISNTFFVQYKFVLAIPTLLNANTRQILFMCHFSILIIFYTRLLMTYAIF